MELAYVKLSNEEVEWALQGVPGWHVVDDQIQKTFKFDTYMGGLDFAIRVGQLAEELDHHPNIIVLYKAVTISVNTHSVSGISPYDFELAKRIDAIGE